MTNSCLGAGLVGYSGPVEGVGIEFEYRPGVAIVRVAGEVDMVSSPALAKGLADVDHRGRSLRHVVVDLSGVSFLDSSGIGALVVWVMACVKQGVTVRVVATPTIRRSFAVTGLVDVLGLADTVDSALIDATADTESES
jgi:anti-sigma B factor antagonist